MDEKIDLNVADLETLQTLPGIGPSLAHRIIAFRTEVHPFEEVIELAAVPGISEKMVRGLADRLAINLPAGTLSLDPAERSAGEQETVVVAAVTAASTADEEIVAEETDKPTEETLNAPESILPGGERDGETTADEADGAGDEPAAAEEETALLADEPDAETTADEADGAGDEPADVEEESALLADGPDEETTTDKADGTGDEPAAAGEESTPPVYASISTIFPETEIAAAEELEAEQTVESSSPPQEMPVVLAEPAAESRPAPAFDSAIWEKQARRRGCVATLIGSTFGAILGAALTLVILSSINNGTLTYSAADAAIINELDSEVISRTNQIDVLTARLAGLATQEADAQAEFAAQQGELSATLMAVDEEIGNLQEQADALDRRISSVAGAADTFNQFLEGLDQLLGNVLTPDANGPLPPNSDATGTTPPTSPPSASTPTGSGELPTRTPQPTATPLFAGSTPAPQP